MKVHNLLVTGSLTSGGENIGSISSSVATTNNTQDNRISSLEVTTGSLNTHTSSVITRLNSIETTTGSLNTFTSSASSRLNSIENVTGSYATTGSNQFKNDQVITGSLTVTGFIDAQELRTTYISSSILYRSGSTKFGDELTDNHTFTGSMLISGSVTTSSSVTAGGAISTSGTGLNASVRINNTTVSTGVDWHLYSLNNGNFGLYNNTSGAYALQISSTGIATFSSTGGSGLRVYGGSGTNQWDIYLNSTNLRFSDNTGTGNIVFDRPLNGTSATFSGNLNLQGAVTRNINFYDSSNTNINAQIQYDQISSTSGQLFFGTNNAGTFATRLTISNTGNVGIGTTSPGTNLHVEGPTVSYGQVRILSTSGSGGEASIHFGRTNQTLEQRWTVGQGVASIGDSFGFYTGGSPRVVLTTGGNVGISTNNPSSTLDVVGITTVGSGTDGSGLKLRGTDGVVFRCIDPTSTGGNSTVNFGAVGTSTGNVRIHATDVLFLANSGNAERMRVTANGLTFNGDTAAANALDDYEEGTWTPRLTGGAGEATYTSRRGWYTKIGRQVTIIWQIYFQKNNMSGTMRMNDLPFTLLSDNSAFYPQGTVLMDTLASVVNNITFQPGNGSNSGDFIQGNGGTLNHEGFSISNLSNSTMLTRGTVTYFT